MLLHYPSFQAHPKPQFCCKFLARTLPILHRKYKACLFGGTGAKNTVLIVFMAFPSGELFGLKKKLMRKGHWAQRNVTDRENLVISRKKSLSLAKCHRQKKFDFTAKSSKMSWKTGCVGPTTKFSQRKLFLWTIQNPNCFCFPHPLSFFLSPPLF